MFWKFQQYGLYFLLIISKLVAFYKSGDRLFLLGSMGQRSRGVAMVVTTVQYQRTAFDLAALELSSACICHEEYIGRGVQIYFASGS
jgi:hypothetical protein